jgi:UDP-N-acetylglucosamine 2-epimerase (non-hydrolysing)
MNIDLTVCFALKYDMLMLQPTIMPYTVHVVVGARPNQMKAAPLLRALTAHPEFEPYLIDTGQHYDHELSGIFMEQFGMGSPAHALEVGSGTHGEQTARILERYEKLLLETPPSATVVIGDINSTVACALACVKLGIPLIHLEAGLRSGDRTMPEEINRIVTDSVADLLWTPSPDGDAHLLSSGVGQEKIVRVGNIMIDTLSSMLQTVQNSKFLENLPTVHDEHVVVTLHRPSNVDDKTQLNLLLDEILLIANEFDVLWPIHPRTRARVVNIERFDELVSHPSIHITKPLGYIDFMKCIHDSRMVITDSGGIQEETTWLGIPCITLRPNTERPITITEGTNVLCVPTNLNAEMNRILSEPPRKNVNIDLWDGNTAERCVKSLFEFLT